MASVVGQYCINVTDLGRSVAFYEAVGLVNASRTEIDQAWEAVMAHPARHGGRLQLAQQKALVEPFDLGTAFCKLVVNTRDVGATHRAAVAAGAEEVLAPMRLEQRPETISVVRDLDGYLAEIVERHPWPDDAPADGPWLGQYCINVSDLDAAVAFYELLGLAVTSRTEVPDAFEAVLASPAGTGGQLQLAQQKAHDGPIRMGSLWKLYVEVDDCTATHDAAVAAGHASVLAPTRLDRWPVTVAFVADPDGYQIELLQRHAPG